MSTPNTPSNSGFQIPSYILDDLCSRFIINIPEEERQNLIRVFFQIEFAHWFYLDFYCQETPSLKACGIKDFSVQVFQHCPNLIQHASSVDKHLESWKGYKMAVPTYGAILLDPTLQYCLLVQGYWSRTSWGFPKGKVNENEAPTDCAIREVLEETGFDISPLLEKDEYLEFKQHEQLSRLYLIGGVSMETKFLPQTRNEIKKLQWFSLDLLPAHKKDLTCKTMLDLPPNSFFMVIPFVKPMRKWVAKRLDRLQKVGKHRTKDVMPSASYVGEDPHSGAAKERLQQLKPIRLFDGNSNDGQDLQPWPGSLSPGRVASHTPSKPHKQSISPRQAKKQMLKQKREGKNPPSGGSAKKSQPTSNVEIYGCDSTSKDQHSVAITKAKSWMNFKLDANAILGCL